MGIAQSHYDQDQLLVLPHELLLEGAQELDIFTLHALAGVNYQLRCAVKGAISARINANLSKFLPYDCIPSFMTTLTNTRSIVGGSVAQAIITPSIFNMAYTSNLNIFTPNGAIEDWKTYLQDLGYVSTDQKNPKPTNRWRSRKTRKPTVFRRGRGGDITKVIIICEADGRSCTTALLNGQFTSQFNFFTANHIYCMYPYLTPHMHSLEIITTRRFLSQSPQRIQLRNRGINILNDEQEEALCDSDILCRLTFRFMGSQGDSQPGRPSDAVGIICWGDDLVEEWVLHDNHVQYRLGGYCANENCPNTAYFDGREE